VKEKEGVEGGGGALRLGGRCGMCD